MERGERLPQIDTVVKVAGALGVPIDDLIDGIEWVPGPLGHGSFSEPSSIPDLPPRS